MTRRTLATFAFVLLALMATLAVPAAAGEWQVDAAHSQVGFSVKHFFTPVNGTFKEFDIQLSYDPDNPTAGSVEVTISVASIDTGDERRDGHLRTGDFFEAEAHPNITFKSTAVRKGEGDSLIATGPLTIKGVSKQIELTIDVLGIQDLPEQMQERMGAKTVAGFSASTKIDRGDFGVGTGNYAATLVIGSDVEISIQVEAKTS